MSYILRRPRGTDESVSGNDGASNRQAVGIDRVVALGVLQVDVGELSAEGHGTTTATATATASAATPAATPAATAQ